MDELKPCPFCGSAGRIYHETDMDGHRFLSVKCDGCGVRTASQWSDDPCPQTYAEVRSRWNTRAASGGDSASLEQRARELLARELDAIRFPAMAAEIRDESGYNTCGAAMVRVVTAALASQQGVGDARDTERLDWLDEQNLQQRMGWEVSQAPAGNVSVQHVVFLGSEPVPIRVAIDAAMSTQPAGDVGSGNG